MTQPPNKITNALATAIAVIFALGLATVLILVFAVFIKRLIGAL